MMAVVCVFFFFVFFISGPLSRNCAFIEIIMLVAIIIVWIFLKKGDCFDFNHSLGFLPYSIHHN